jgi:predicted NBD/HSP70 family sugar kinase
MQYLLTVEVDEDGTPSVALREFTEGEALEARRAVQAQARAAKAAEKARAKATAEAQRKADEEAARILQENTEELARLTDVAVKVADDAITRGRGGSYVEISESAARVHHATQRIRTARDFATKNGLAVSPALGVAERRLLPLKAELGIR